MPRVAGGTGVATGAELTYNTGATALQMANTIFGGGATVVGARYTGWGNSSAIYSNGQLSPGVVPGNTGVILSTGNVRDFTQSNGDPNRSAGTSTDTSGPDNVAQINAIAGTNTFDAAYLDINFIPTASVMTIRFVFASEEYPEYSSSIYNDLMFVVVNGTPATLSFGNGLGSVSNVNPDTNANLFVSNMNDDFNTEMDGFTLTMSLKMNVNPGVVNSIRIGIADVSDALYDSNLLIAADSVQTALVARDDAITLRSGASGDIDPLANDINNTGGVLTVTHINGVPVTVGSVVTLPSGQTVRLNADMTFSVTTDQDIETTVFNYNLRSSTGAEDVGIVRVTTIPCFTAGTRIATPGGLVPVETLRPGDLVLTLDDGPRPLRWVGRRRVLAAGALAPVRIGAGALGPHGRLVVSPQHRILIRDRRAELLFGEAEVLVAAKDLVNGRCIVQRPGGEVEYLHLLLDRHAVLFAEGLAAESLLPGGEGLRGFGAEAVAEIRALFPALDPATGAGYGPAARPILRAHEARVLFGTAAAVHARAA